MDALQAVACLCAGDGNGRSGRSVVGRAPLGGPALPPCAGRGKIVENRFASERTDLLAAGWGNWVASCGPMRNLSAFFPRSLTSSIAKKGGGRSSTSGRTDLLTGGWGNWLASCGLMRNLSAFFPSSLAS